VESSQEFAVQDLDQEEYAFLDFQGMRTMLECQFQRTAWTIESHYQRIAFIEMETLRFNSATSQTEAICWHQKCIF
jgi:hypothetical protein